MYKVKPGKGWQNFSKRNTLVIGNTLFQEHKRQLYTWTSPDGQYQNQINYILCTWTIVVAVRQQQDKETTEAQIINSLLQNLSLNWTESGKPLGFSYGSDSQESHLQCRRPGFDYWVGKIPWRRMWQPTPVFLPGESPWTEEPGGLQFIGSQRVGHNWASKDTQGTPLCHSGLTKIKIPYDFTG